MPNKTNHWCVLPWNHFSADASGHARPCCINEYFKIPHHMHRLANITNSTGIDWFNGEMQKELRRTMIAGKRHNTCSRCWMIEDGGGESWRQTFNKTFSELSTDKMKELTNPDGSIKPEFVIEYVDIQLGNKCNLRCRMCNPWSSSLWANDVKQHPELNLWNVELTEDFEWFKDPNVLKEKIYPLLSTIKRINFVGAEPFLVDEFYIILEKLINLGRANEVAVSFNTNLTVFNDRLKNLLKHFKRVGFSMSIDGYKELNEYMRYPVKWKRWIKNTRAVQEWKGANIDSNLHCTFGMYNILHLDKFIKWCADTDLGTTSAFPFFIYISQPDYQDPIHLPGDLKKIAKERILDAIHYFEIHHGKTSIENKHINVLLSYLDQFEKHGSEEEWDIFVKNANDLDRIRNQDILSIVPEFKKYWKYE